MVQARAHALRPRGARAPGAACARTIAIVAARALAPGEELYLDYGFELTDDERIPAWFHPAQLRGDDADAADADADADAARKRPEDALKAELHAWKAEFERARGRAPTRDDIKADPVAARLFEAFTKCTVFQWPEEMRGGPFQSLRR